MKKYLTSQELKEIQKPAQYIGGERGSVVKDDSEIDLHVCFAFPDTYEVGMSHVGIQILYDLVNKDPKIWAERAYAPQPDMERLLRKRAVPLSSLESSRPLTEFDIVGFSLQYELCMGGILAILDLAKIPLLASERDDSHPIIIGGGPVCYHPEPFADFFDAFLIGDGEELVPEFFDFVKSQKENGATRDEILDAITEMQGVYVPKFFTPKYSPTGKLIEMTPEKEGYTSVRRRIVASLEGASYPEDPIVPNIKAVHDRLSVEVMRGCVRGCRFCQAGYLYRPQRERKPEEILNIIDNSLQNTGYEELSLLSLSTADYCSVLPLLSSIKERFADKDQLAVSFPSTRVDALKPELLQEVQTVRRSGFTIAPEAGTQRLRDVINKGVTEEQLMDTCRNVFKLGWSGIKMYFMIGLPTETDEDVEGIVDLARKVKAIAGNRADITVSASTHVPKPHTPFQWAGQITEGETVRKQQYLKQELRKARVNFRYHNAFSSFLEGVFARGDRQLGKVIHHAYQLGSRLEGWEEELNKDVWLQAFEETGIDPHHYLHERIEEDFLPWEHISCDIPKRYFLKEWQRAVGSRTTPDCLTQSCSVCGACDYDATRNVLFDRSRTEERLDIVSPPWLKIIEKREAGQTTNLLDDGPELSNDDQNGASSKDGGYQLRDYLQTEADTGRSRAVPERKAAPITQIVRLRYGKEKEARFFAHLELASIFFRAARRANLPVAFSQGFHPKPKFSFGPPIQLGLESQFEFVDVNLYERVENEFIVKRLNKELPDGLRIYECHDIDRATPAIQNSISVQHYKLSCTEDIDLPADWEKLEVERVRKRKTTTASLGGSVLSITQTSSSELEFAIRADSSTPVLKPLEVVGALFDTEEFDFEIIKTNIQWQGQSSTEAEAELVC